VASGSTTPYKIGRGSIVIPRPDGKYLVIPGTSLQNCTLQTVTMTFDPYTMAFMANPSAPMTNGTGPGAFAFERSDGQWVIIKGGATLSTCASLNSTNIYNPFTNLMLVGPTTTAISSRHGGQVMQRPDGTWAVTYGGAVTTSMIYYEKSGAFTTSAFPGPVGTFMAGPTLYAATGTGAVAFQRDDGKYLILAGANAAGSQGVNTAQIYDAGFVTEGYYRSEAINIPDLDSTSTLSWKALPDYKDISAQVRTGTSALTLRASTIRDVPYSGSPINPGAGETFVSVIFNLRRKVPNNPGIFEDVWYNGGSTPAVRYREIKTPTVTEFSINKDSDLVNLKADKLSLFRVSTNGDIYTGNKGSLFSGGADLAERYASPEELSAGEVVTYDYTDSHAVRRSTSPYQDELLGVISTNPGFVGGAYTKDSYPVALVGRVPVNTMIEPGQAIRVGDRLTSGSIPGYAQKAQRAGRVIGFALEPGNPATFKACTADPKKLCGQVMVFINLSDWPGPALAADGE
jgi:hypothetical protein